MEATKQVTQAASVVRFRFSGDPHEHPWFQIVRNNFHRAELLLRLSQRTAVELEGKDQTIDASFQYMRDAATVGETVDRAMKVVSRALTMTMVAGDWARPVSSVRKEQLERLDTEDELRNRLEQDREVMDLLEIQLKRVEAEEVPARLPAANAQLGLCAQGARGSWKASNRLREELLSAVSAIQAETRPNARRRALSEEMAKQRAAVRTEADIVYTAGRAARMAVLPSHYEFLPLLRLNYNSPLELILAINGAVAGTVAVLNQVLDLRVRYKTRDEKALAIKTKLEREIAEDSAARDASLALKKSYPDYAGQLGISEVEIADDLDDLSEDLR